MNTQRFANVQRRYRDQQDLAWWPKDPPADPCAPSELFFYRPGQMLIHKESYRYVTRLLDGLGVNFCRQRDDDDDRRPVARVLLASREPVPVVMQRLRCLGVGPDAATCNHVLFPTLDGFTSGGVPWLSGGQDSAPLPAANPPTVTAPQRGQGVTALVFDSGLLPEWKDGRDWLGRVEPMGAPDVEGQGGDPDTEGLDIFDSHAMFAAGVLACAAGQADIRVRNVLSELGDVDDAALAGMIAESLESGYAGVPLVNLSLGGTTQNSEYPLALHDVIASYPEVVFVAAAGNNGPDAAAVPFYPAAMALPNVIGVGALTADGVPAPFSNVAPSAQVWARGADVVNAFGNGELTYGIPPSVSTFNSGVAHWNGTSFAAPYVTAVLCDYVSSPQATGGAGALPWLAQHFTRPNGMIIVE